MIFHFAPVGYLPRMNLEPRRGTLFAGRTRWPRGAPDARYFQRKVPVSGPRPAPRQLGYMPVLYEPQTSLDGVRRDNTGALGPARHRLFFRLLGGELPPFNRLRRSPFGGRPIAFSEGAC